VIRKPPPGGSKTTRFSARLALALTLALVAFLGIYRPLHLRWGATREEMARTMPGDEIQPAPIFNATRAVTIDAPPNKIWPWLVQIGYGRAGWYGLDLLDNGGIPSARRIIPELQGFGVGDTLPIFPAVPPISPGAYQAVIAAEPDQYLLTKGNDDTTWIWALYPIDEGHTRLIWRMRSTPYEWLKPTIVAQLLTELVDYVAVSENMLGIKERVEGWATPAYRLYLQAWLWLVVFIVYLVANSGIVVWRDWRRTLLVAVAAALVTIALALTRPPLWVDAVAAVSACTALAWARRQRGRQPSRG
jgi:hypothetical protein